MRQNRSSQRKGRLSDEQRKLLPVVIVPLIVIILMIIIVLADRARAKTGADASTPSQGVEASVEPETMEPGGSGDGQAADGENGQAGSESEPAETEPVETDPADAFATDAFRRDSIPEILDLMKTYFQARTDADAETMKRIYGAGEVSAAELEEETARMRNNAKYVQGFENVTTYVMDGTTPDAWLVYTVADIRFLSVKTPAPMIMWCYVKKDAEGNYLMVDPAALSENVLQLVDVANHSETVRRLASSVNVRLKEALTEDEDLNTVYGVLRDGSPVWENSSDEPEVIIGGEETTAESSAAETDSAAESSSAAETGSVPEETGSAPAETDSAPAENGESVGGTTE